jgi:hypothetical protein
MQDIDELLKIASPIALALAWIWSQYRQAEKDEAASKEKHEDRDRIYAERLEGRLEKAQGELQQALSSIKPSVDAETILKLVVANDPGVMFLKKRLSKNKYIVLKVSRGYAILYLGGPSEIIEGKSDEIIGASSVNDELAYANGGMMVREKIDSPLTDTKGYFVGRKFPITFGTETYIVGVAEHEFSKEA